MPNEPGNGNGEPPITDEQAEDFEEEAPAGPAGSGVGDLVRRALLAGVGAVFMTEEQIRKGVQELKLPKEAFGYIAGQAEKTRAEASRVLRKEIRRFLNSEAFRQQVSELLSGVTLEIKAEVRLKPQPELGTAKVRVKPTPKGEGEKE